MNKSTLKTKMRRKGFRCGPHKWTQWNPDGTTQTGLTRFSWRKGWLYCKGFGRYFRVRLKAGVVDIGEVYETFDRWANSTERSLTIDEFAKEYL